MEQAESSGTVPGSWSPDHILGTKYKIIELLANTSRCEIYKAKELQYPHATVVIKRLKPDMTSDNDARWRFQREVAVLRKIPHQSVLPIYDSETEGQELYFVTELADQGSLTDYLNHHPNHVLSPFEALEIAISVCQGLKATHKRGIIHCDIKPGNILLFSQDDGSILAKLADFGIARVPKEFGDELRSEEYLFVGTLFYASPEQLKGEVPDARSDLYSWALVFLEMLTGESPTTLTSDEFSLSFFTERKIPPELSEVLHKALRNDKDLRQQSAEEVLKALESIKDQVIAADIAQLLEAGKEHLQKQQWEEAGIEFKQGLELCEWYGEPKELTGSIGELAQKLQMGCQCVRGMMYLTAQQLQSAIDVLQPLQHLNPDDLGLDIAAHLRQARSKVDFERKYQEILKLKDQGDWTQVLKRVTELTTDYKSHPQGESLRDIRKLALYVKGRELAEKGEVEKAYHLLDRLHEMDVDYGDVAEQCATAAFRNAMRLDIPTNLKHQVEWLEKAIRISPGHKEGRTRKQLDEARHKWAKELLKENNRRDAVAQLEEISSDYNQRADVQSLLVETYQTEGDQEYKNRNWRDAIKWWERALHISPGLDGTLRRRIREVKVRAWIKDHEPYVVLISAVFAVLTCTIGVIAMVWQQQQGNRLENITPAQTTTMSTLTPALTLTALIASPPTGTPVLAGPTFTAMPSDTPTPSPIPTATHTSISTATTPPPSISTPTRRPTTTSTLTPILTATEKEPPPTHSNPTHTPEPP